MHAKKSQQSLLMLSLQPKHIRGILKMAYPEANTRCGKLRGCVQKNIDGNEFYAFKGVPYAKPPVGDLRFKDPISAEPWQGTRDAQNYGPMCAQIDFFAQFTGGSDDCLYLNVFTKNLDLNANLPVMVWIHGGGFVLGSGDDLYSGPDYFMKKDIVLVTINYRLGILGFLNMDQEGAFGNQGLKDQVMALEWVRDNITNFGGDPRNVTIFGESAGGAAIHFLTMSPLAKGLFHKAISHSGVALNPWSKYVGEQKIMVKEMCKHLGKNLTDPKEMIEFLKTVDALKLAEAQEAVRIAKDDTGSYNLFCPVDDSKSPNPFMPMPKEEAAQEGAHVPYLIGFNNCEGTMMLKCVEEKLGAINDSNFHKYILPESLNLLKDMGLTLNDLKNMYLDSEKGFEDTKGLIDMLGDLLMVHGIHKVVRYQVERSAAPTYMYQFTYDKGFNFSKWLKSDIKGATHMDELLYLFNMKLIEKINIDQIPKGSKMYHVMEQMLELWTNFARTGMPTPTVNDLVPLYWQPVVDTTVFRYMNIGEELRMEKMLNLEERFLYKKNGSPKF